MEPGESRNHEGVIVRDVPLSNRSLESCLPSLMFSKALPRAVVRSTRAFHSSSSVARVVSKNPVKAEEVKVSRWQAYRTLLMTI